MLNVLMLTAVLASLPQEVRAQCPVTTSLAPGFVPPGPLADLGGDRWFWYGTPDLWTRLPRDGRSIARDKSFWWSPDYNRTREIRPDLRVTATSLDNGVVVSMKRATNASSGDLGGWTMLTMLEFPSAGCWSVTAAYQHRTVTFVTLVR
jgi:hypothetical protein